MSAAGQQARWLAIVGIGEDGAEGLSAAARALITNAKLVVGGKRHLALADGLPSGERMTWPSPIAESISAILAHRGEPVAVLASGDPYCFGVGAMLSAHVPVEETICLPAPSSLSLACARLGWALDDIAAVSLCGRPLETLAPALQPKRRVLVLSADATTPASVARYLAQRGFGRSKLHDRAFHRRRPAKPLRSHYRSDRSLASIRQGTASMTVHFIGAGPGAPDLLTLRGADLIARCPVCLYAGSLVNKEILALCPEGARIVDTAPMSLDEIVAEFEAAHRAGHDVARLHSGDLSVWSAVGEQLRRLDALHIPYTLTPGVPAFAAAAAALKRELTLPEVAQSLVLTRTSGRASAMPPRETLPAFAATGATLVLHLSIQALPRVVEELTPFYGADCPAAVVVRASWPDERIIEATLGTLLSEVANDPPERTALILVGRVLAAEDFRDSALYDANYRRRYRLGGAA